MPSVMVDTQLFSHPRARKLGRLLKDPDAWRYLVKLWAWAIDQDMADGVFEALDDDLATDAGYRGDPAIFRSALLECGWLFEEGVSYRLHAWKRNERYFKEKARKRRYSADRRRSADSSAESSALRRAEVGESARATSRDPILSCPVPILSDPRTTAASDRVSRAASSSHADMQRPLRFLSSEEDNPLVRHVDLARELGAGEVLELLTDCWAEPPPLAKQAITAATTDAGLRERPATGAHVLEAHDKALAAVDRTKFGDNAGRHQQALWRYAAKAFAASLEPPGDDGDDWAAIDDMEAHWDRQGDNGDGATVGESWDETEELNEDDDVGAAWE